jgi:hypothetical protein
VIPRLNAKPTSETEEKLLKVEVESMEDLERLGEEELHRRARA